MDNGLRLSKDDRQRDLEFADRTDHTGDQLLSALDAAISGVTETLRRQTEANLRRPLMIQDFGVTGVEAIFRSVSHFQGHTQEIIFRTRLLLGEQYEFSERDKKARGEANADGLRPAWA